MKIFHTADWHLGKLVQGIYMTEDQAYVLDEFIREVKREQPDVIIIAGDLYDRAVPPTEAVQLLSRVIDTLVLELEIPVLAIAGNHDSPSRVHFGSNVMRGQGLYMAGNMTNDYAPVVLNDEHGEVHFHLVPFCDPSVVSHVFQDESVKTHHQAMEKITTHLQKNLDNQARHVFIGHAFVTPSGKEEENTSESERPLSVGGSEYVDAKLFEVFDYTALGHLHQAHYVMNENIRYAGSLLKYSLSEAHHNKGYLVIEMDSEGFCHIEKRLLTPRRDLRALEGKMDDLLNKERSDDYVFVRLLDETPVLSPMEKLRAVFPNCMHVDRKLDKMLIADNDEPKVQRQSLSEIELFRAFYQEVTATEVTPEAETVFTKVLDEMLKKERETPTSQS